MAGRKDAHRNKPLSSKNRWVLIASVLMGFIFCIHGIEWGTVETWHPDQMAVGKLIHDGRITLAPENFLKPPFHTYFNFFFSSLPIHAIGNAFELPQDSLKTAELILSRMLTALFFLGAIVLVFCICNKSFDQSAAATVTVLFATSAGLIAFSHFLTADIPLMFWMLLAFCGAQNVALRGRNVDYVLAGFLTGIAAATKYNGLAVGAALVAAHALNLRTFSLGRLIFNKKLAAGLFMVPAGFLIGNPFAVIDFPRFWTDFVYNYATTPVYSGKTTGVGYWDFLYRVTEVIGLPMSAILTCALIYSVFGLFKFDWRADRKSGVILPLFLFAIYFLKIGSFPRLETRFVMPVVPFLFIASGPFWETVTTRRILFPVALAVLLIYNIICCYYVGERFNLDPRMAAQAWVQHNLPHGSTIESSFYSPHWGKLADVVLRDRRMPLVTGRAELFRQIFSGNENILDLVERFDPDDDKRVLWYTAKHLERRRPSYIAVNSLYYSRFMEGVMSKHYPSMQAFFTALIEEEYPYKIVFNLKSPDAANCTYPRQIDFLENRMIILERQKR